VNSCFIASFPLVVTMINTIVAFFLTYKKKKERSRNKEFNKVEQNGKIKKKKKYAS
jgi:choline-glycine betaine transporter